MTEDSYPRGFREWSLEKRNAWFAEEAREYDRKRSFAEGANDEPQQAMVILTCASKMQVAPIRWVWPGWIAKGKMHIIGGQPGAGKSTLAMRIGATISAGARWPDGTVATRGNVIIWSGEDDPMDTLVPRLAASGADRERIYFVSDVADCRGKRPFDPAKDIERLQSAIKAVGGAELIVVDPIISAVSGDSHKNSETRRSLQPLVDLASATGAALLGVTHFSKGTSGREPIERINGSIAFGALARVVMVAAKEPVSEDGTVGRRILARAKSNIGPDEGGFAYSLELRPMPGRPEIEASIAAWGERIDGTAREMLAVAEAEPGVLADSSATDEAKAFLIDILSNGPMPSKQVKADASGAGLAWRTVRRAKDDLRIKARKENGEWRWSLPHVVQGGHVVQPLNLGQVGQVGQVKENQHVTCGQGGQGGHVVQGGQEFGAGHLGGLEASNDHPGDGWECEI
jgi:putative DNA primase/helicase